MSRLSIFLLGAPEFFLDGEPVQLGRQKAIALLAYMAVTGGSHRRDTLAGLLWPEYEQNKARTTLRIMLSELKKSLGPQFFTVDQHSIKLNLDNNIWLDYAQFHHLLSECQYHYHPLTRPCPTCVPLLAEAVTLYRGEFLAGFTLSDSAIFDDWQQQQSTEIQHHLGLVLEGLVCGHWQLKDRDTAVKYARQWIAADPLHELAYRHLIDLYLEKGDHLAAHREYEAYCQLLAQELAVVPSIQFQKLQQVIGQPEKLRSLTGEADEARLFSKNYLSSEPGVAEKTIPHNLPHMLTPFFGREKELTDIGDLLDDPQCRLLTLVGPGGIGKSRLALEVGHQLVAPRKNRHAPGAEVFTNGVYFVPLTSITTAEQTISAIAHFVGFSFYGREDTRTQLVNYLRQKRLLLILDNLEQLMAETALLTDILANAPQVKLLATSRERLKLPHEWLFLVDGLDYPPETDQSDSVDLQQYSAIRLFCQRARRVHAGFMPSSENKAHLLRICQLLEGIPLGIEIAASSLQLITCGDLKENISQNMVALATSRREFSRRHQSLYATFEHSWYLLTVEEREILRALSVFRGGFTVEAAAYVGKASLYTLGSLLDKSLVHRDASGRFGIHESLRQYFDEKSKEEPVNRLATTERYCTYFTNLMAQLADDLRAGRQIEAVALISSDLTNIRRVWQYVLEKRDVVLMEKLVDPFFRYHGICSLAEVGYHTFSSAIDVFDSDKNGANPLLVAHLSVRKASLCVRLSRLEEGSDLCQKSATVFERENDLEELAFTYSLLGVMSLVKGEFDQASTYLQQSLRLAIKCDHLQHTLNAQSNLGIMAYWQGNLELAEDLLKKSANQRRKIDDWFGLTNDLFTLAQLKSRLDAYEEAKELYNESLQIGAKLKSPQILAHNYGGLARLSYKSGDLQAGRMYNDQALHIYLEIGEQLAKAELLANLGYSYFVENKWTEAEKHYLAALKIAWVEQMVPYLTNILLQLIRLYDKTGREAEAFFLLNISQPHFVGENDKIKEGEKLYSSLESTLPSENANRIREAARQAGLESVVTKLVEGNELTFLPERKMSDYALRPNTVLAQQNAPES